MTTDIVERLRELAEHHEGFFIDEAADEIERFRKDNTDLQNKVVMPLRQRVAELEADAVLVERDAERYRYLRDVAWHTGSLIFYAERYGPEDWDDHIDAELFARTAAADCHSGGLPSCRSHSHRGDGMSDELPQGYEPHELPVDYTGKLYIEGQMRAAIAAERERWRSAVNDEPELPGPMPRQMLEYMTSGESEMTEAMRAAVREIKRSILERATAIRKGTP